MVKLSMCSMNFWQRIIIRDWAMKYSPSSIVYLMLCLCGGKFVISSVSDKQLTNECYSIVTFFLAFFIMCFEKSTTTTRFVVAPISIFCITLIAWCIWVAWEPSQTLEWWMTQLHWETTGDEETGRFWQWFCIGRRNPAASDADV